MIGDILSLLPSGAWNIWRQRLCLIQLSCPLSWTVCDTWYWGNKIKEGITCFFPTQFSFYKSPWLSLKYRAGQNVHLGFPYYHMEKPEQAFWPTQYLHVKQHQDFRVTLALGMWLAPSCWISVSAKRRVDGTQCLLGSLPPWWEVGKRGKRVHGLR